MVQCQIAKLVDLSQRDYVMWFENLTEKILAAGWESLVSRKIVKEGHQVGSKVGPLHWSGKAENIHIPLRVGPNVQCPVIVVYIHSSDRVANWFNAPNLRQPITHQTLAQSTLQRIATYQIIIS